MFPLWYAFRHMERTKILIIGVAGIFLIAGIAQFLFPQSAIAPQPVVSEPLPVENTVATTSVEVKKVTVTGSTKMTPVLPVIAKGDSIASWTFKGAYADNPDLILKAQVEIARLSGFLGGGTYPDVSLYIGIANQYELLGDGKQQYDYLSRAIKEGGITGLPWHNLGVLMERLGALETARVAYERSTLIQPAIKFYHYAYFEFLTTRMKSDTVAIEKEYAAALKNLGQDADILQLYSEWKQS